MARLDRRIWIGVGAGAGVLLTLALLLLPVSPIEQLPEAEPDRRGKVSRFDIAAGAGVAYTSPAAYLANLGIPYERRIIPAGNYTAGGIAPRGAVVHNTDSPLSLGCGPVYNHFANPDVRASTHFCIDRDGVHQFVPLGDVAWGQGDVRSPNRGIPVLDEIVRNGWYMNQFFWSIEVALDYQPTTEYIEDHPSLVEYLSALVKYLALQGGFSLDRMHILAHNDINSLSRVDPICCWRRPGLAAGAQGFDSWVAGLGAAPEPSVDVDALLQRVQFLEGEQVSTWKMLTILREQIAGLGQGQPAILIKLADQNPVYLVLGGLRLHICNPEQFLAQGFSWGAIRIVTEDDPLWQIPKLDACS